jgi:hypothetical protein
MRAGPDAVLEHVLHEAAHVLNWTRDVSDTAIRGAYHNQSFLAAAEEVGLEWPNHAERVAGKGFVNPVVSDGARARHRDDVAALGQLIPELLPHMQLPEVKSRRTPDRLTLCCQCTPPRKLRVSRTVAAQGPITCGVCGSEFVEE